MRLRFCVIPLFLIALTKFCLWQTGGFALTKMISPSAFSPSTDVQIQLEKPLIFLDSGKQFYTFEIPDQPYVLKFVKFSRKSPLPWLANLPFPPLISSWRDHYLAKRSCRLAHLKKSTTLALQRIPHLTGLLPTPSLSHMTLIDKLGIHHTPNPSHTLYFLQLKATPFTTYFSTHLSEAHPLIDSYIQTVTSQCLQGLCNLDPLIERNYGVVNHAVIILDIGSFLPHDKLTTLTGLQQQIFLELLPLREWLQQYHPPYLPYFDTCFKKIYQR